MIGFDDEMPAIEMTIVQPPFLLDFSSACLDEAPDFPAGVLGEWRAEKQEQFAVRWPTVDLVLSELREYGIYLLDIHPGNITFVRQS